MAIHTAKKRIFLFLQQYFSLSSHYEKYINRTIILLFCK